MVILYILAFFLAPAAMLWLCKRYSWLGKIGPVLLLYFLGLILGNIGYKPEGLAVVQETLSSAMVPLAIPLMLFGCRFRKSETKGQLLALITGIVAVVLVVVAGFFVFRSSVPDADKIGGMMMGCYTGGAVNFAALKAMLDVPEGTFVLLNSYHLLISFFYLLFLLAAGIKLFRMFLPNTSSRLDAPVAISSEEIEIFDEQKNNPYKGLFTKAGMKEFGVQFGFTLLVVALSAGIALACTSTGIADGSAFTPVFLLSVTTFSIAGSFLKTLKNRKYGYDVGMYCIYIFCMVVASQADVSTLDIKSGVGMLGYLSFVIFMSLFVHVLLAKIFRVDSDTTVIASVAYICSPAMVPMIVGAMKNKNVLAAGLAIGVFGYAIGNYIGFLVAKLLALFM